MLGKVTKRLLAISLISVSIFAMVGCSNSQSSKAMMQQVHLQLHLLLVIPLLYFQGMGLLILLHGTTCQ